MKIFAITFFYRRIDASDKAFHASFDSYVINLETIPFLGNPLSQSNINSRIHEAKILDGYNII